MKYPYGKRLKELRAQAGLIRFLGTGKAYDYNKHDFSDRKVISNGTERFFRRLGKKGFREKSLSKDGLFYIKTIDIWSGKVYNM